VKKHLVRKMSLISKKKKKARKKGFNDFAQRFGVDLSKDPLDPKKKHKQQQQPKKPSWKDDPRLHEPENYQIKQKHKAAVFYDKQGNKIKSKKPCPEPNKVRVKSYCRKKPNKK
jgi:23S rRNA pseudoU1915 N3-methylase RlmH